MILRGLFAARSGTGRGRRLSVLIFHRVLERPDPLFPEEMHAERFEHLCGWLKSWFRVLPLEEAATRLAEGRLPPRALAITFDDGYADNRTVAAPILQRHGLPCTFFVATGFLDGGRMWNDTLIEAFRGCGADALDLSPLHPGLRACALGTPALRRAAIDHTIAVAKYLPPPARLALVDAVARRAGVRPPDDLMMTGAQVRELRAIGLQVGAHTVTHPILLGLDRAAALAEVAASKRHLEALLDEEVSLFAYPNGKPGVDYGDESVDVVREAGFRFAVSTQWGVSTAATDRLQLRRFTPWDRGRLRFGLRLLGNLGRKT